jgi:hypothetical protein
LSSDKYHTIQVVFDAEPFDSLRKIVLDGVELRGIREVEIRTRYDDVTEVTITLIANVAMVRHGN